MTLQQSSADAQAAPTTRLAVLLFTDIVGSTELKSKLGMASYSQLLTRHNELFEKHLAEFPKARIIKHTGDGYFAVFPTASDAVRFALLFQSRIGLEPPGSMPLKVRVGIHTGEIAVMGMAGRRDVIGLSADMAARIMSLAVGGQILMTSAVFNDARQFVIGAPKGLHGDPQLRWIAHGPYLFKGTEEPLEVFEAGIEGFSPLSRPADSEKVKRVVPHDQEQTLGWRPAAGLEVPARQNWVLERKIGEGGFGEVWLGQHVKLRERRVFKFCFDAERLRSFKRELTLFRLLREVLGQRPDIAALRGTKLDDPPFFLESDYAEGGNLLEWSARKGGIDKVELSQRLQLVAQVSDAVAAAHSIGILHKDIKPGNILIREESDGTITPKLADFGIGVIADRSRLRSHAITEAGFTQVTAADDISRTGTRLYAPPESLLNKPFTIQGDIYALGVLLYQMVVGDLSRPLAPGWERDIEDPLLRSDIGEMVEGDTARRISSASDVAQRLRLLDQRRQEQREQQQSMVTQARRKQLTRLAVVAACGMFLVFACGSAGIWLHLRGVHEAQNRTLAALEEARRARADAEREKFEAVHQSALLERQQLEAERQKAIAQARFNDVHTLATKVLFDIDDQLANVPGTTKARSTLGKAAQESLDKLAVDASNDPALAAEAAAAYFRLGQVQGSYWNASLGDRAGGAATFQKGLAIAKKLADADPNNSDAQARLAHAYLEAQSVGLNDYVPDALAIYQKLAPAHPNDWYYVAESLRRTAWAFESKGDMPHALETMRSARATWEKYAQTNPGAPPVQDELTGCDEWIASVTAREQGKPAEMLELRKKALERLQKIASADLSDGHIQSELADAYNALADVQAPQGSLDDALTNYRAANAIFQKLFTADPNDANARQNFTKTCDNVGNLLMRKGDHAGAQEIYLRGQMAKYDVKDLNPTTIDLQLQLTAAYQAVGSRLRDHGDFGGATESYRKRIAILQKILDADATNPRAQGQLASTLGAIGDLLMSQNDLNGALESYRRSLTIRQSLAASSTVDKDQQYLLTALGKLGPVLEKLAGDASRPVSERIDLWREARQAYMREKDQFDRMKAANQLQPADLKREDAIAGNTGRCNAAIAQLNSATTQTAGK